VALYAIVLIEEIFLSADPIYLVDRGTCDRLGCKARIEWTFLFGTQLTFDDPLYNMISLITGPIAGPSRLRCFARSIHYTPRSYASPKKRTRVTTTPTLPSSPITPQQIPRQSPTQSSVISKTAGSIHRTPPLAAAWRWKPLPNPSPDVVEEERTVFARPFESGRPRMYWFGFLVSGLFFTTWLTFPPSARSLAPADGET
jgi:hypothetical protein